MDTAIVKIRNFIGKQCIDSLLINLLYYKCSAQFHTFFSTARFTAV